MQVRFMRFGRPLLSLLIALTIGSCGLEKNQFPPVCPVPGLLKPLAELTRYRAGSQDLRDLIVRARIVDIVGRCQPGDDNYTVAAFAQVVVDVTRGPAMEGLTYDLPAFIAVTDSGTIRDKALLTLPIEFPGNVDNTRVSSKEVRMEIPITPQKSAAAYGIIGGFQLTPEEVATWRRNNHLQ